MTTGALAAYGVLLKLGNGATSETFTTIAEVAARSRCGWWAAHSSTCIPPIEPPAAHSSRSMPR